VPSIDQILKIVNGWGLVLYQDEQQVKAESSQSLFIAVLVDRAHIRNSIASAIVGGDDVDERNEQIFSMGGPPAGEEGTVGVEDKDVLVRGVVEGLRKDDDAQAEEGYSVRIKFAFLIVDSLHNTEP